MGSRQFFGCIRSVNIQVYFIERCIQRSVEIKHRYSSSFKHEIKAKLVHDLLGEERLEFIIVKIHSGTSQFLSSDVH